ncbi:hypothetical protein MKX03_014869, partial [Papaver bracteatum]
MFAISYKLSHFVQVSPFFILRVATSNPVKPCNSLDLDKKEKNSFSSSPVEFRTRIHHQWLLFEPHSSRKSLTGLKSQNLRSEFCREFQTFLLPNLPYDYSALEPVISGEIMQLHHQKHHQTYITNYNKVLEKLHETIEKGDSQTVVKLQSSIKFNGG